MPGPRPSLQSFINFANATPRGRESVVQTIRRQSVAEYSPATDYWKRMRDATKRDRRTTRDGAAVSAAAVNATEKKRGAFAEVAARWQEIIPRWEASRYEAPTTGSTEIAGLEIVVSPRFVEVWESGAREASFVYFNQPVLHGTTIDVVLRTIERAFPGEELTPAFIDVRRGAVHTQIQRDRDIVDGELDELSAEFLGRWAA